MLLGRRQMAAVAREIGIAIRFDVIEVALIPIGFFLGQLSAVARLD